ncbi:MAG: hypothetical protein ACI9WL_001619, partial [Rubritalea sp.]
CSPSLLVDPSFIAEYYCFCNSIDGVDACSF